VGNKKTHKILKFQSLIFCYRLRIRKIVYVNWAKLNLLTFFICFYLEWGEGGETSTTKVKRKRVLLIFRRKRPCKKMVSIIWRKMVTTGEINKTQMFAKTGYVACFYCTRLCHIILQQSWQRSLAVFYFDARRLHRYKCTVRLDFTF